MMHRLIDRHDDGPIVVLTLNRPERRNALSRKLVSELSDALESIEPDPAVRSVVITGSGISFCSGMDLNESSDASRSTATEAQAAADLQGIADLIDRIHSLSRPTIAALNGDALAAGAGVALACDFVIAARSARIGYPEIKRGLVAAVVMRDLVAQVGDRRARALLLTGEPIDADQALLWGLAHRVVENEHCQREAMAMAHSLTASAPMALATTKRLLDDQSPGPRDLRAAAAISAAIRGSEEALEGMNAFLEKRSPRWYQESQGR